MARIDTDKTINPSQLGVELGRVPIRHVEGKYVDAEGVGAANLQAAVDAHTPDPQWVDPDAPPPPPDPDDELDAALAAAAAKATTAEKVDALIAALRGKSGRAGRAAGRPTQ